MQIRTYPAIVKKWVDGDTADLTVDLGYKLYAVVRFRLAGINTPEKGKEGYAEATNYALELAPIGSAVTVECSGYDKYGRWVADIISGEVNVNEALLDKGLAEVYIE